MKYFNFQKQIFEEYRTICLQNEAISKERCVHAITSLRSEIVKNIKDGSYSKAGGSTLYKEDREILKQKYYEFENLGVKVCILKVLLITYTYNNKILANIV